MFFFHPWRHAYFPWGSSFSLWREPESKLWAAQGLLLGNVDIRKGIGYIIWNLYIPITFLLLVLFVHRFAKICILIHLIALNIEPFIYLNMWTFIIYIYICKCAVLINPIQLNLIKSTWLYVFAASLFGTAIANSVIHWHLLNHSALQLLVAPFSVDSLPISDVLLSGEDMSHTYKWVAQLDTHSSRFVNVRSFGGSRKDVVGQRCLRWSNHAKQ